MRLSLSRGQNFIEQVLNDFFYFKSQQTVCPALHRNITLREDDAERGGVGWVQDRGDGEVPLKGQF